MKNIPDNKIDEISERLKAIEKLITFKNKIPQEIILDNCEFIRLMRISKRTAQNWRVTGIIGYSMIGNKIYYKMAEIQALIDKHYHQEGN
ncbi:MAG: helix-turn-helix domain-containing protein [Bacteroidota bacterium]|nr:helix-turn-helix domain-containing protein [Bacteroidota bacterium]